MAAAQRRRAKNVLEATHDLANQIATDDGVDTPPVENARAEVVRVRR